MNIIADMHVHTRYADGENTVFETGKEAREKGIRLLGFSEHAYVGGSEPFGIKEEELDSYINDVYTLRGMYAQDMLVLCGLEMENISGFQYIDDFQQSQLDYLIGSTHTLIKDGVDFAVDYSEEYLKEKVDALYGGDWYALVRDYYALCAKVAENTDCDIIGHFDLITKFNQDMKHFDEESDAYLEPALAAMDELLRADIPFEINTGAISRGYRKEPYPSARLLRELKQRGGRICLNSDAHDMYFLGYGFDEAAKLAAECGFETYSVLTPEGWKEIPLC